jgi:PAS domain S-box-containing protein
LEGVLAGEHILIIENDPEYVEFLLANVMATHQYLAQTATCGQAGLKAAQEERFDLVLLGLGLNDIPNAEMLRGLQVLGNPPVVLMSSPGTEAEALQGFRLGVRDALVKPFPAQEIARAIARVLHQERLAWERDWLVRKLAAANEDLECSLTKLQTLYDTGTTIGANLNLQDTLAAVVQAAVSITHAEEGYLLLCDEDSSDFYLRAVQSTDADRTEMTGLRVQVNHVDSVAGHVVRTGEPVALSSADGADLKIEPGYRVQSLVNVPLFKQGRVIGVLGVNNVVSDQCFAEQDVRLLSALAGHATNAVNNAQLYTRTDQTLSRRVTEAAALHTLVRASQKADNAKHIAGQALAHAMQVTGALSGTIGLGANGLQNGYLFDDLYTQVVKGDSIAQEMVWINHEGTPVQPDPCLESTVRLAVDSGQPQWTQMANDSLGPCIYLAVPVPHGGVVWGGIGLQIRSGLLLDDVQNDLRFLNELVYHIAEWLVQARLAAELAALRHKSDLVLRNTAEGVFTVNQDLQITSANPAMERITGWREDEMVGRRYDEVFVPQIQSHRLPPEQTLPGRALELAMASGQSTILGKYNRRIPVSGTATLLKGADASVIGVLTTMRDLTPETELSQLRREFSTLLAHWLRAPLAQVSAAVEVLLRADLPHDVQNEVFTALHAQSSNLAQLAEEMLDVVRLEAGAAQPQLHPVTLKPIIDHVVKNFQSAVSDCAFQVRLAPDLPFVIGDENKIELALANLIDNALLSGHPHQPVVISAEVNDDCVVVAVRRKGLASIPGERVKLVQFSGNGQNALNDQDEPWRVTPEMGLYIAKELIRTQGGQVWIENQPGTSARFRFSLPKMEVRDDAQALVD